MSGPDTPEVGRSLSVELRQLRHVKSIVVSDRDWDQVLFEGNIGQLVEASMDDHMVLEVRGENGILRVDLTLDELEAMISRIHSTRFASSCLVPSRGAGKN